MTWKLHSRHLRASIFAGCLALASAAVAQQPEAQQILSLGLRGMYFVPNQGQWSDEEVCFGLKSRGLDVAFRESQLTMHLSREVSEHSEPGRVVPTNALNALNELHSLNAPNDSSDRIRSGSLGSLDERRFKHLTLTVSFPGSNPVTPRGAQPQEAKFNYFVGGEGRGVASDVPSFGAVVYDNLYDGVDLHVMGNDQGVLKYEFHCAPGADYGQVRIHYDGIESLCIDDSGDLQINTSFGTLRDGAPIVWYSDDATDLVPARFELVDTRTYCITLDGKVDPTRGLIMDPDVQWALYLGGTSSDSGHDVAVDRAGDILVVGETKSSDFEGRRNSISGIEDAFAAKLSPEGDLRWMTYIGGRSNDYGYGVAVDAAGTAIMTGDTRSFDFPGRGNSLHDVGPDAFIARVNSSGVLQGMLYLGGNSFDYAHSVALDQDGNAFVSGRTESSDFDGRINVSHGGADAYVVKVSAAGAIDWMTYIGGSTREDSAFATLDGPGNILVAGETLSLDFEGMTNQHHGGATDSYLASLDPSGHIQWMKYIGGSDFEKDTRIAVDLENNLFVGGSTLSPDLEQAINGHHGHYDAFLAKLDPGGVLLWTTYMGGTDQDIQLDIAAEPAGSLITMGDTRSWDFEGQNNTKIPYRLQEGFVTRIAPDGRLQAMSYIRGVLSQESSGIAAGADGRAIMAGTTSATEFEGQLNQLHGELMSDAIAVSRRIEASWLSIVSSCPGGGPIQVSWNGATPGAPVALLAAPDPTWYVIPEGLPCADSLLNIGGSPTRVVYRGTAGPDGSRILNANAGPDACGTYLQMIELSTCNKSNVVRVE